MDPRPKPNSPCGGMFAPEMALMHPKEYFGMTSFPSPKASCTSEAENDEPPPYDWLKEHPAGDPARHESPRAWAHWGTEQSNCPKVVDVLGEKVMEEHPVHPEHGTQAMSLLVSRTMYMSWPGVPNLIWTM